MIGRLAEALVAGPPHPHLRPALPFATPLGDRRHPDVEPQRVIVSRPQGPGGLRKHRGGHLSSDAWQGPEDLDVTMLISLAVDRLLRGQLG